jgi:hemerythrin
MTHEWDKSLETGHETIDSQHKQLFVAIYDLLDNCVKESTADTLKKSLDFLNSYTIKHFFDEEQIQQKCKYPDFANHKKLHDDFKIVVRDMSHQLIMKGPSTDLVEQVKEKIYGWLVSHIRIQDLKLGAHIRSVDAAT